MSHLPTERLAALADEPPTAAELAHLSSCADCARERAAYRSLVKLAASAASSIGAPLTSWDALRSKLLDDGAIGGEPVVVRSRRAAGRVWLQAAAAVLLVAGGVVAGRVSAGASPASITPDRSVAAAALPADSTPHFRSIDEARAAQAQSQLLYQTATAYLAQSDTTTRSAESPAAIRTRLAALDRTRQVLDEALDEAPYDPVINGYYLTTLGQREATLRQLNTVAPASMRLTSY
jgi:hypothetical protein